ncbi:hypothetical protein MC885_002236 [Smutsia gigantea]|nr:hypothetical protein MC885_002236 [Smutsia gigantea]
MHPNRQNVVPAQNVQRVLTFQPLRFIQEHVLIPVFDPSGPSSLAPPVQYSQVKVSRSREPSEAPPRHSLSEVTYLGQPDISILQPSRVPPHQALSRQSYAPQAAPEVKPPSYAPQPPSYGMCMEGSSKDSPPVALSSSNHLRPNAQLQKETPAGHYIPGGLSLQVVISLDVEEPREAKSFPQPLGVHMDSAEPGTPGCLKGELPLLSSVQIEGQPMSLPLHTPSLPCSPADQAPSPWGLLESLVCPSHEGPLPEAEAERPGPRASDLEQPTELDSLFRGLALTVHWEP